MNITDVIQKLDTGNYWLTTSGELVEKDNWLIRIIKSLLCMYGHIKAKNVIQSLRDLKPKWLMRDDTDLIQRVYKGFFGTFNSATKWKHETSIDLLKEDIAAEMRIKERLLDAAVDSRDEGQCHKLLRKFIPSSACQERLFRRGLNEGWRHTYFKALVGEGGLSTLARHQLFHDSVEAGNRDATRALLSSSEIDDAERVDLLGFFSRMRGLELSDAEFLSVVKWIVPPKMRISYTESLIRVGSGILTVPRETGHYLLGRLTGMPSGVRPLLTQLLDAEGEDEARELAGRLAIRLRRHGLQLGDDFGGGPGHGALHDDFSHDHRYTIALSILNNDPGLVLFYLSENHYPTSITFAGEQGVDGGGLSRQFGSVLHRSLVKNKVLQREGGLLKAYDGCEDYYKQWGILLRKLSERNANLTTKLLIGRHFHDEFFRILKLVAQETGDEFEASHDLKKEIAKTLARLAPDKAIVGRYFTDPTANEEDMAAICIPEEGEELFQLAYFDYVHPFYLAAQQVCSGLGHDLKARIVREDHKRISKEFQGEPLTSGQALVEAIEMSTFNCVDDADKRLLERQVGWVKEALRTGSEQVRKDFLQFVTGQEGFQHGLKIDIRRRERRLDGTDDEIFFPHTCYNAIEVPRCDDKQAFLRGLLAGIGSDIGINRV